MPRSEAQRTCFTVDIVICIIILILAILTLGVALILFLVYIPCSLIVHAIIYLAEKRQKKKKVKREEKALHDQNKPHDS